MALNKSLIALTAFIWIIIQIMTANSTRIRRSGPTTFLNSKGSFRYERNYPYKSDAHGLYGYYGDDERYAYSGDGGSGSGFGKIPNTGTDDEDYNGGSGSGSGEIPNEKCPLGELGCLSGGCAKLCDGIKQCLGGEDEDYCPKITKTTAKPTTTKTTTKPTIKTTTTKPPPPVCDTGDFQCSEGTCLSPHRRCNFVKECLAGEDEMDCACEKPNFSCGSGLCIKSEKICDGTKHCSDGTDEPEECPNPYVPVDLKLLQLQVNIIEKSLQSCMKCVEKECIASGGREINNLCYSAHTDKPRTFYEAKNHCKSLGGTLPAVVDTKNFLSKLDVTFPEIKTQGIWLGSAGAIKASVNDNKLLGERETVLETADECVSADILYGTEHTVMEVPCSYRYNVVCQYR